MTLREYLTLSRTPIPVLADALGVSVQAVHRYANGERIPRPDVMVRIKVETRGAVQPNDFFCPLEAA